MAIGKILYLDPITGLPKQLWNSDTATISNIDVIGTDNLQIAGAGSTASGIDLGTGLGIGKIITFGSPAGGQVQIGDGNIRLIPSSTAVGSLVFGNHPLTDDGFQILANTGATAPAGFRYNDLVLPDAPKGRWEYRNDDDSWAPFASGWTLEFDLAGNLVFVTSWTGAIPSGLYPHEHIEWIVSGGTSVWSIRRDLTLPEYDPVGDPSSTERFVTVYTSTNKAGTPLHVKAGSGGSAGDYAGADLVLEAGQASGTSTTGGWLCLQAGANATGSTIGKVVLGRVVDAAYALYAMTQTGDALPGLRYVKTGDRWEHKTNDESESAWRPLIVTAKATAAESITAGMAVGLAVNSVTPANSLWKVDANTGLASDTTPYVRGLAFNSGSAGDVVYIVENGDLPVDSALFVGTTPTSSHVGYRVWADTTGGASAGKLTIDVPSSGTKTKVGFIKEVGTNVTIAVQIGDPT